MCPLRLASRRGVDSLLVLALGGVELPAQVRHLVLRRRRHRRRRDVRGLITLRLQVGGALRRAGALTHRRAAAADGEEGRARLLALGPRRLELQLRAGQCAAELHHLRLRRRRATAVAAERAAKSGGARLVEALAQPLDLAFDLVDLRRLRTQPLGVARCSSSSGGGIIGDGSLPAHLVRVGIRDLGRLRYRLGRLLGVGLGPPRVSLGLGLSLGLRLGLRLRLRRLRLTMSVSVFHQ